MPMAECIVDNVDGSVTARFGYRNDNAVAVEVPVSILNNYFTPQPLDRGQTTVFQPGVVEDAFRVTFSDVTTVAWLVRGPDNILRSAVATTTFIPCDNEIVLNEGPLEFTLIWNTGADYDLSLFEPNGTRIAFDQQGPTSTGGRFQLDSNSGCVQTNPTDPSGVEHIYWPQTANPEAGIYRINVTLFSDCGFAPADWTLIMRVEGVVQRVVTRTGPGIANQLFTYNPPAPTPEGNPR